MRSLIDKAGYIRRFSKYKVLRKVYWLRVNNEGFRRSLIDKAGYIKRFSKLKGLRKVYW